MQAFNVDEQNPLNKKGHFDMYILIAMIIILMI